MGVWHFMKKTWHTVEHEAAGTAQDPASADVLGRDRAKRMIAAQLGVNPYSHNPVLAEELEKAAWVTVSGGLTIAGAGVALGPVGVAMTGVGVADTMSKEQVVLSPAELKITLLKQLEGYGVTLEAAQAFGANDAYDPWSAGALVNAVAPLAQVPGLDAFIREAATATNEIDAFYFRRVAQLMATYHARTARVQIIEAPEKIVSFTDASGNVVVPIWVDYVQWTLAADEVAARLQDRAKRMNAAKLVILASGALSDRSKEELRKRGIDFMEKVFRP